MCIRDSPDTANTAQGETKEIPINIKYEDDSPFSICTQVMVAIFDGNKSYNQQSEIGRIGILSSEGSKLLKSRLTVSKAKPVSYTHLDVYKRQSTNNYFN